MTGRKQDRRKQGQGGSRDLQVPEQRIISRAFRPGKFLIWIMNPENARVSDPTVLVWLNCTDKFPLSTQARGEPDSRQCIERNS